jgi:hypothetical protein
MAAQGATDKVKSMLADDDLASTLQRMHDEAAETEARCTTLAGEFEGKKTAILDSARETKQEGSEMMQTYLGDEDDPARRLRIPDHGRGRRGRPLVDRQQAERAGRRRSRR